MPRMTINVTVTDNGDGSYDFVVQDEIDVQPGNSTLHFKRSPPSTTEWKFTNISIWKGEKSDEPSTPSLVAPFTLRRLRDGVIKIEDDNPGSSDGSESKYYYRLYGEYNGVAIDHDPEIHNQP